MKQEIVHVYWEILEDNEVVDTGMHFFGSKKAAQRFDAHLKDNNSAVNSRFIYDTFTYESV